MGERIFVRVFLWVPRVDELGICDPGINNLDLQEGRIARVNGASVERWASEVLRNSAAEDAHLEAIMLDGRRVRIWGSAASQFHVLYEQGGRQSYFASLATTARFLAASSAP